MVSREHASPSGLSFPPGPSLSYPIFSQDDQRSVIPREEAE